MNDIASKGCMANEPSLARRARAERERVAELAAKARRGTHAIFATRVLSVLVTFTSITVLARLIPPADFGVWAMASFALGVVTIIREFGLLSSIVQAPQLTTQQRDAYFWNSVAVSLASAGILALAAPLLARVYDAPLLQPVLWTCCISLALTGLGLVHAALLRRDLHFDKVSLIEGGGMLCGLTTGIVTAFVWRDVWALVAGYVAQHLWTAGMAVALCRWRPGAPRRAAKADLSFSFQVMAYNLLTYVGNNVGLAAGYRLGAADLGFLNRGQQLSHLAHYAFLTPITDVGVALLCRLKAAAYRDAYIALARRVAVLFVPLAAVLPIVAPDLVLALLGPAWAPASPILAWFALAVFGQAFAALFAQLLTSQGRGDELRTWAIADLFLRGGGAVLGSQLGIVGLAAGFGLVTFFVTVPCMAWIAGRSGPVQARHQLRAMWPGVVLGAAAALGACIASQGADALELGAGWSRLLFVGSGAALAWATLCLVLRPARDALLGKGLAHE